MTDHMHPTEANARFTLGKLGSEAIVALANAWLEEGVYTEPLAELCTIVHPEMAEVGPLFESAMQELGIGHVTREQAGRQLLGLTLQRIADGQIDAVDGAEFLYWDIHGGVLSGLPDRDYVGDSLGLEHVFCWLREIWDCRDGSMLMYHEDLPRDHAEVKFIEHLVEAAREWLSQHGAGS